MKYDVAGLGNAIVDALVHVPDEELAAHGLTRGLMHPVEHGRWQELFAHYGEGAEIATGGSCANTIAALGLLGARAIFCGQVGSDDFGALYAQQLKEACGRHALHVGQGNTGKCLSLISLAADAERTLCTDLGVATTLPHVGEFGADIAESQILHLTGYLFLGGPMSEAAWSAGQFARSKGVKVSLDVADPFVIATVKDRMWDAVRDLADIVFLNEEEAKALTGVEGEEALRVVAEHAETVIVKLGGRGSLISHRGEITRVGAHMVTAIDTTGAGDSYAAGFLYGYCRGWPMARSGDLAARVAALTVSQIGAVVRDRKTLSQALAAVEPA